jgi:adenylosuccinate synthase
MSVDIVLGLQWGDEGKGKIVDKLSENADVVVRFQGGANAGHTVYYEDNKIVLHLIPSGIIHKGTICIIGNGVVLDPEILAEEISYLNKFNIKCSGKLFISKRAHLVFPFHKEMDRYIEEFMKKGQLGTTKRGIGPAYTDKFRRIGIRVGDLYNDDYFENQLEKIVNYYNLQFSKIFKEEEIDYKKMRNHFLNYRNLLYRYVKNTEEMLYKYQQEGKRILLEGAQAGLLDIDYGTYPYVTSSNTTLGGVFTGSSVSPFMINNVYGVTKAYTTRVGAGPFPTIFKDENFANEFRDKAGEYGAATGRPRNCGWLDLVALKHTVKINYITKIILTKLDEISGIDKLKICTEYNINGEKTDIFPPEIYKLNIVEPIYTELSGWDDDISSVRDRKLLPDNAKKYLQFIEDYIGVPIDIISVGKFREDIIQRKG